MFRHEQKKKAIRMLFLEQEGELRYHVADTKP
jgi:hypothetical protein